MLADIIADKADLTDAEVCEWLHTPSVAARQLVPRWRIKDLLYRHGAWPLLLAAQANANSQIAGVAITAIAYLNDADFENLDLDLPEIGGMFDALQSAGVLDEAGRAELEALADVLQTPLEAAGLSAAVDESAVGIARGTRPLVQQETH